MAISDIVQLCLTLCNPMDCSPWNSSGHNPGVGSLSLLQGIFPTQGSNPGLPHCRQILYQLSHKGSPRILRSNLNLMMPHLGVNSPKNSVKYMKYIYIYISMQKQKDKFTVIIGDANTSFSIINRNSRKNLTLLPLTDILLNASRKLILFK